MSDITKEKRRGRHISAVKVSDLHKHTGHKFNGCLAAVSSLYSQFHTGKPSLWHEHYSCHMRTLTG